MSPCLVSHGERSLQNVKSAAGYCCIENPIYALIVGQHEQAVPSSTQQPKPSAIGKSADCRLKKPENDRLARAAFVIIRSDMNSLNIDKTTTTVSPITNKRTNMIRLPRVRARGRRCTPWSE